MGRQNQNTMTLPDGRTVGYSLTKRPGGCRVRFVGPDGSRLERSAGCRKKGEARRAATEIINAAYAPAMSPEPAKATWDAALAHLEATPDLRPDSVRDYKTAVNAFRRLNPGLRGPADVTPAMAGQFKRDFLTGTYARGKASDAKRYRRSPTSCVTYLRHLSSLWSKHWIPAAFASDNPWKAVPRPKANAKRVRDPEPGAVAALLAWLAARYPDWESPRLYVLVKTLAGCRTMDLCQAKTADLTGDGLILAGATTKTGEARPIHLPPDVAADLRRIAGPVWLWERTAAEARLYRPAARTRRDAPFSPSTWRDILRNLFKEFNHSRPDRPKLNPHDLRSGAITEALALGFEVDKVARMMGMSTQMVRHYADGERAFRVTEGQRQLAEVLRAKCGDSVAVGVEGEPEN